MTVKGEEALAARGGGARGTILFVGSSTFTYWAHMSRDLAPLKVTNLAFGGSHTADVLQFAEAYAKLKPSLIVYYCGVNDIAKGKKPDTALHNVTEFVRRVRAIDSSIPFVYVAGSVTPYQIFIGKEKRLREMNSKVADYVKTQPRMHFIDITQEAGFSTNLKWYLNDGLHLNDEGHIRLGEIIKPAIESFQASLA